MPHCFLQQKITTKFHFLSFQAQGKTWTPSITQGIGIPPGAKGGPQERAAAPGGAQYPPHLTPAQHTMDQMRSAEKVHSFFRH